MTQIVQSDLSNQTKSVGMSVASLVLGILSCLLPLPIFGAILGGLAIVFGLLGRKRAGRKMAMAGIILGIIGILLMSILIGAATMRSNLLDDSSHFVGDSTYENSKYHFKLVYPKGSIFANAHPEVGFVTRFFLPNGETIGNDQENVGIYIEENSNDLEREVQEIRERFSEYGPIDMREVQFGGQKGYRMVLTTSYSAQKGTKELIYITVKDDTSYHLNYFPVAKNISIVDTVAGSFEFTQ